MDNKKMTLVVEVQEGANPVVMGDTINGLKVERVISGEVDKPVLTLELLEKKYILDTLDMFEGNKTQAAQFLGITIKTLYNKLHKYGSFDFYAKRKKKQETENA